MCVGVCVCSHVPLDVLYSKVDRLLRLLRHLLLLLRLLLLLVRLPVAPPVGVIVRVDSPHRARTCPPLRSPCRGRRPCRLF